jgi:hypothetical protein
VGCLITDFRTAGRGKFKFGGQVGRPTTAQRPPDRTQIIWGMCLITDFRTTGRGKFKLGGQVGETDYSTAPPGSDPNYLGRPLWRAMLSSDASLGMWATDCGRTQVPGFLMHLVEN